MSLNPKAKINTGSGGDLPILTVYLAGRIAGNVIDKCIAWRRKIINFYKNYKGKGWYPIAFIDPLNSGEDKTVDGLGLDSHLPKNLIYDKDILSVETADVVVANLEDFFDVTVLDILELTMNDLMERDKATLVDMLVRLIDLIKNRRENIGTIMEVAIALYLRKPVILVVPEKRREIFEKHPFTVRASAITTSVDELLEKKWLNILYKSIAGAV